MTTNQVLFGVALTVVLAVGSQVLAGSLRIPALIVLLPVGLTAGAMTDDIQPDHLLGAAFQPLVSLAVALILFDAGVGLDLRKPGGHTRRTVIRLVTIGVAITWGLAAFIAAPLVGMSRPAAVMLGAILAVSGPTVVGLLLQRENRELRMKSEFLGKAAALFSPRSIGEREVLVDRRGKGRLAAGGELAVRAQDRRWCDDPAVPGGGVLAAAGPRRRGRRGRRDRPVQPWSLGTALQ